ncbi:hypothetical protein NOR_04956 [Metarhizium rileyi]|uniref:Uncharacterized protein n=1 Tax=Metarhizium rileyi (strain RCEF 4871) TaxID=1649241 RepID=A0A167D9K4_METRR|nr:hypothetical protein NOR_04956 [Metarhizium rileyi RCEF 4871]
MGIAPVAEEGQVRITFGREVTIISVVGWFAFGIAQHSANTISRGVLQIRHRVESAVGYNGGEKGKTGQGERGDK